VQKPREPKPPRPKEPEQVSLIGDNEPLIIDKTHVDHATDVLYEHSEIIGQFNFRDTILEQLERYFFYLDRMRKFDREAWDLYKRVGGLLVPYSSVPDIVLDRQEGDEKEWDAYLRRHKKETRLSPWFLKTRPSFGCVAYGVSPEIEKIEHTPIPGKGKRWGRWVPKFMYFWKYDKSAIPCELQKVAGDGDFYKMTIWWDRGGEKDKWGTPQEYGIYVAPDGSMTVLKMIETKIFYAESKKHHGDKTRIPQRLWQIPHDMEEWAHKHGTTAQIYLSNLFAENAFRWEGAISTMIKISVCNNKRYACFGIDVHRLPYFFKDRDFVLNENGHRKRIVHLVRPYTDKNGVHHGFQFRGEKQFTWAGYEVTVTIPGLDHPMWEELNIGFYDQREIKDSKRNYGDMKSMGKLIRKNISGEAA